MLSREKKYSTVVSNAVEALSIACNTKVYEKKYRGEDVIIMSLGEAHFDLPLLPFDTLPFPEIYQYSHSRGIPELRKKLARYFDEQYNFSFDFQKDILVTAGSKAAIYMTFMSILNPGDEVIILEPYWVSYTEQVRLCYGKPVTVPYDIPVFELETYITDKTRCIVVNNPHNPTGKIYSREELEHLLYISRKNDLYLLSDEAYSDFVLDPNEFISLGALDPAKEKTIVCNSISKNYGISGWRLGYAITHPELINQILKVNQHLITCPATILEYYIAEYFYDILEITKPQIKAVVTLRNKLAEYMTGIGLDYLPGTATFYFLVSIEPSKLNSDAFAAKLLNEYNVSTVPGAGYGQSCDKHIRVCVGAETWERMIKAVDSIKTLIHLTS